ncbi:MAG: ribose-phosphate pyrophosphokinase [Lachnospiraceae bacterium]|nr:ribose-phosphate pyrophosphokinase [Lachnospiraceae bacterium]
MPDQSKLVTVPVGKLALVPMKNCEPLGKKVDQYLAKWRKDRDQLANDGLIFNGYERDSYILESDCPRFASGEAKGTLKDSVRGADLYIISDVTNTGIEYNLGGRMVPMTPDEHYADIKRVIAASAGKAKRINVIMPFLYESRQHKRSGRESLDCALALQELASMGVENIITFDAHDPRVQNAIPTCGFESLMPTYQFIKSLLKSVPDLELDNDHLMIISPDEGAMHRAIYFANQFGVDVGMFYKRRDYSRVVNGKNPIVAHEFLGDSVEGKDVIIIDDMIASGESMLDVARQLKARKARRVFCFATFGLFTAGLGVFDKAYEEGTIDLIVTTNVSYQNPDLFGRKWYQSADLYKYIALIIDHLNHDVSISDLLDPSERIQTRLNEYKETHTIKDNYESK